MKIVRVVFAFILTLVMLYIARTNSMGQPKYYEHSENGYTFEYTNVPSGKLNSTVEIPISISGDITDSTKLIFRRSATPDNLDSFSSEELKRTDDYNIFQITQPTGDIGKRFYYFFEIKDQFSTTLARFTMDEEGTPFVLKYEGDVPGIVLYSHLFFIFATVFCIAMATMQSLTLISGKSTNKRLVAFWLFLAVIACFIGGYPIGFGMNWYAYGAVWEGVPFGTDATDNKTQLLFVYIIFAFIVGLGSFKNRPEKDLFSPKAYGWLGFSTIIFMLFIYLIPHSIQFSKALTYGVCYSFIGLMFLWYILAHFKKRKQLVNE